MGGKKKGMRPMVFDEFLYRLRGEILQGISVFGVRSLTPKKKKKKNKTF